MSRASSSEKTCPARSARGARPNSPVALGIAISETTDPAPAESPTP